MDCFVAALLARTTERSLRRDNRPLDLAEPHTITIALAPAPHHERIAVLQERALDAAVELDRLGAIPADLEQAAALIFLRPGDRAASQEITDIHRAAARRVMHQLL